MAVRLDEDERLSIKFELLRKGLTQRKVADLVGIDERAMSDFLLGRRNLSDEVVSKIHKVIVMCE